MIELKRVCIVCPKGCELTIKEIDSEKRQIKVTGNACKRGEAFAFQECYDPRRTLQTTVQTTFKTYPRLSVKTAGSIPKQAVFDVMREVKKVVVERVMASGEIVVANIADTGVDLISTSDMNLYHNHE